MPQMLHVPLVMNIKRFSVFHLKQPVNEAQETELIEAMHAADLDGDGTINYEEFIVATVNLAKLEKVCHRDAMFNQFLDKAEG